MTACSPRASWAPSSSASRATTSSGATAQPRADLWVCQLPIVEYREALALQERLRDARQRDEIPDTLLLLEHWPVYTRGRRATPGELPMGEAWYLSQGIDVVDVRRGGKVTYHGPGQLVGYPIMAIADVIFFIRTIEQAIVSALAGEGVEARAREAEGPDFTGVWTQERKIASIGVHVARGVATHGFAINVQNDLQPFSWVVPCGLDGVRMTSVLKETAGSGELLEGFRLRMAEHFAAAFDRTAVAVAPDDLLRAQGALAS